MKKIFILLLCIFTLLIFLCPHLEAQTDSLKQIVQGFSDAPELKAVKAICRPLKELAPNTQGSAYVNVLQDCWTTEEFTADPELEQYLFDANHFIGFIWKHKIFEPCENYMATIVGTPCREGKPPIKVAWMIRNIQFGPIPPGMEYLFGIMVPPAIAPGDYDWFIVTECNDTNGIIPPNPDGDIDDVIGANLGLLRPPVVYGSEPVEILDPDPGGWPPGRRPGEEGSTRCWCFRVQ